MANHLEDVPVGAAKAEEAKDSPDAPKAYTDTVVVGGGQAGLSISYWLSQEGREHLVLEKARPGEAWRSQKWDSFTLVTPNWHLGLPGFGYNGDDPDGYLSRDQVVRYIDDYVARCTPPLRLGVEVTSVERKPGDHGFTVETTTGPVEASNVVMATGTFQKPRLPVHSRHLSSHPAQLHTSRYRNPEHLPPGAVLVVGSGQSGCQITEELYQSGRKVYLCTGNARRAPRRYRGKDFIWWLNEMGFMDRTVDDLDSPAERFKGNPHVTGKNGGHTLNLHQFALDGVTLLGRLRGASGSKIWLADDLMANLATGDKFAAQLLESVDRFVEKTGIAAPEEDVPVLRAGYDSEVITDLDLHAAGVTSIIWATGYTYDFRMVKVPIWDSAGYPVQKRGVTAEPGLYFLGLHWMHTLKSGLFAGIADDARHVAAHIAGRT